MGRTAVTAKLAMAARARAQPYAAPAPAGAKKPRAKKERDEAAEAAKAAAAAAALAAAPPRIVQGLGTPGGKHFVYFNSRVGARESTRRWRRLSNFAKSSKPIDFRGNRFWTSEHAYQSRKVHPGDVWRFTIYGDLGDLRGFEHFMDKDTAEKKMQFWGKGDVSMDGIVAKMVVNPDWNKKLKTPLRLRPMSADGDIEAQSALWRAILMAKARADSEYRNLLEVSGDTFFVEFDRGARSAFLDTKKRNPFWTGLVDKESGELFGANFMGVCQMRNRDRLLPVAAGTGRRESEAPTLLLAGELAPVALACTRGSLA